MDIHKYSRILEGRKMVKFRRALVLTAAFIAVVLGAGDARAQHRITGTWTADADSVGKHKDKLQISFALDREKDRQQNSSSFAYSELEGLSSPPNGNVKFRLVREAGIIECQGVFNNGRGSGTFQFEASQAFIDNMRTRGFDFERSEKQNTSQKPEDRLFAAALINVTTAQADDLLAANFASLDIGDLFKAAIFKIDGSFMAEMKATGFPDLDMEDLVKARIFKVDANFVRQAKEMGITDQGLEGLVKLRIFNVTPEFMSEMRAAGFNNITAEEVVKCRIFKIDGEFARQAKASEPDVTIEDLVQMKIGVRRNH